MPRCNAGKVAAMLWHNAVPPWAPAVPDPADIEVPGPTELDVASAAYFTGVPTNAERSDLRRGHQAAPDD